MAAKPQTFQEPLLACQVCLTEIPSTVAASLEGRDYVHYFCGAECYQIWDDQLESPPDRCDE